MELVAMQGILRIRQRKVRATLLPIYSQQNVRQRQQRRQQEQCRYRHRIQSYITIIIHDMTITNIRTMFLML